MLLYIIVWMEGIVYVTGGFTPCLVLADGLIKPEAKKMRYKSNVRLNRGKTWRFGS